MNSITVAVKEVNKTTLKDTVKVLKSAKKTSLGYGMAALQFEKDDPLAMEVYGGFTVDSINCEGDDIYGICLSGRARDAK